MGVAAVALAYPPACLCGPSTAGGHATRMAPPVHLTTETARAVYIVGGVPESLEQLKRHHFPLCVPLSFRSLPNNLTSILHFTSHYHVVLILAQL